MKNLYFLHPIFPNISPPSSPLYCSLYSLTLGVGKPTLHMDDLPGGSNILEIKNIWSEANIFYISSANVDPSGCARNWKIGSTPQLGLAAWLVADLCTSWSSAAEQVVSIYPRFASLQIFEYKVGRRIEQLHIIDGSCNHHHVYLFTERDDSCH